MEGIGSADRWNRLRRLLRPLARWLVREPVEREPEPSEIGVGATGPDRSPRPATRDSVP